MPTTRRTFTPEFGAGPSSSSQAGTQLRRGLRDLDIGEHPPGWKACSLRAALSCSPGGEPRPPWRRSCARLRAENKRLAMERDILKKATAFFARGRHECDFIEHAPPGAMAGPDDVPGPAPRPAATTTGGGGRRAPRRRGAKALVVAIKAVHGEVKARYGSPEDPRRTGRPRHGLQREHRGRVDARHGSPPGRSGSSASRPTRTTTARWPARTCWIAGSRSRPPDQAWTADITYLATGEGWLYLAAVEDLYSRRIVGWSMSSRIDSRLVVDALEMALARRLPGRGLVAHSDRGASTPASTTSAPGRWGITCSMSRRGNCWDNAAMESFFASLKKELTHGESFATRAERGGVVRVHRGVYNRLRRHSSLGYLSRRQSTNEPDKPLTRRPAIRGKSMERLRERALPTPPTRARTAAGPWRRRRRTRRTSFGWCIATRWTTSGRCGGRCGS